MKKTIKDRDFSSSNAEDSALMKKVAKGDKKSFDRLIVKYKKIILDYLFTKFKSVDQSCYDDILSQVFLAVWNNRTKFDQGKKFHSWIMTFVNNRTIDLVRRSYRYGVLIARHTVEINVHFKVVCFPDDVEKRENVFEVRNALAQITPEQRQSILLWMDGYSDTQIAKILGKPPGTIKARIRRGKVKMKEFLLERL